MRGNRLRNNNYEWVGVCWSYLRGDLILFLSVKAIVRILYEGGHYSTCGYYSRKCGICRFSNSLVTVCVIMYSATEQEKQKSNFSV